MSRRVVITGLGAVTPLGLNAADSWNAVREGVCGIAPITQYDITDRAVTLAAEVKGFDPDALLGKAEAKRMDRYCQFAIVAAQEALEDSGIKKEEIDPIRCGVVVSSGIGGFSTLEAAKMRALEKGYDKVSPFMIPSIISNMAAGRIAIHVGFQGMCTCPVTACAGGSNAVGDAFRHIRDGYAEVMLCGGAEGGHLSHGVYPGIGAAAAAHFHFLAGQSAQQSLQLFLDGIFGVALLLPAVVAAAVVAEGQAIGVHGGNSFQTSDTIISRIADIRKLCTLYTYSKK